MSQADDYSSLDTPDNEPTPDSESESDAGVLEYTPKETGEEVLRQLREMEKWDYDHLFAAVSGGDDSITAAQFAYESEHIELDGVLHCDTGIGVPKTREFVREWCEERDLELVVVGNHNARFEHERYEHLIKIHGFPGSAPEAHSQMFRNLKEKPISRFQSNIEDSDEQLAFISGVRRAESRNRYQELGDEAIQKVHGQIWASPLVDFTEMDLHDYRNERDNLEQSIVAATICISGECLCGAYGNRAKTLTELRQYFPEVANHIYNLEYTVLEQVARGEIRRDRCLWAHGSTDDNGHYERDEETIQAGITCSDCEDSCAAAYEMGEMEPEFQSPVEQFLIDHDLSEYHNWPFYCAPCDMVVDDPYTHRKEVHPFDADEEDGLPARWDMRRVELAESDKAGRLITEPNGWRHNTSQLTRNKSQAENSKHTYYYEDHALSHCDNHNHTWTEYNDGPVRECEDCHCFDLTDYDPADPGPPIVAHKTSAERELTVAEKATKSEHRALDEFEAGGDNRHLVTRGTSKVAEEADPKQSNPQNDTTLAEFI